MFGNQTDRINRITHVFILGRFSWQFADLGSLIDEFARKKADLTDREVSDYLGLRDLPGLRCRSKSCRPKIWF
ncbi:hypothetical protein AXF42_Ash007909 [Apostasia shenzhenica]|uniref:Uncharacterized protein n=1 Tax=Apostasia shenzhenica TaxID=1088818 RepID=A0A2I0B5P3_9ASPA|nr:hypothetical protein AXF42_Ash007909 [Apostasia shenzhenica]